MLKHANTQVQLDRIRDMSSGFSSMTFQALDRALIEFGGAAAESVSLQPSERIGLVRGALPIDGSELPLITNTFVAMIRELPPTEGTSLRINCGMAIRQGEGALARIEISLAANGNITSLDSGDPLHTSSPTTPLFDLTSAQGQQSANELVDVVVGAIKRIKQG